MFGEVKLARLCASLGRAFKKGSDQDIRRSTLTVGTAVNRYDLHLLSLSLGFLVNTGKA
jgi:hypothetical protein